MAKGKRTTVGIKAYEQLGEELEASKLECARLRDLATERSREKVAADKEVADLKDERDMLRFRIEEQVQRASKAEGYAVALLDQIDPARPELPWIPKYDTYGNKIQ